jgi:hypothetical protein
MRPLYLKKLIFFSNYRVGILHFLKKVKISAPLLDKLQNKLYKLLVTTKTLVLLVSYGKLQPYLIFK